MLYEILKHIKNFFLTDESVQDTFEVVDGTIDSLSFLTGSYVLIQGSILNDGVYAYPLTNLSTETFKGTITQLAIPKDFLSLVDEIETYVEAQSGKYSPYTSESFGGYSYTKATNSSGTVGDWSTVFRERLNTWRKI